MDGDKFRNYILGFIFYKYLFEKMHLYADEILKHDESNTKKLKKGLLMVIFI